MYIFFISSSQLIFSHGETGIFKQRVITAIVGHLSVIRELLVQASISAGIRRRLLWYRISSRWPASVYLGPKRAHLRILMFKIQTTCLSAAGWSRFWVQLVPHQIFFLNLFSEFALTRPPWRPKWFSINYAKLCWVSQRLTILAISAFCSSIDGCCIYFYVGTSWDTMVLCAALTLSVGGSCDISFSTLSAARIVTVNWT